MAYKQQNQMKSNITFFNLGNADSTLIRINRTGKTIVWDYANMQGEKHCDLPAEMNKRITKDHCDVACFTLGDEDHVKGMSEYFYLEHSSSYQDSKRKKIKELWVPAAILLESRNDLCEDAKLLKAEAKHRFLKMKSKVLVFSKPDALKEWVEKEGVKFKDVEHLIIDAGKLIPGWDKLTDGIEFFVHSPFKGHVDDNTEIDRNTAAIIVQATFGNNTETKMILGGDADSDNWRDIVKISRYKKSQDRLVWDLFHISHHCSYKALNLEEKGNSKTIPIPEVKWLFENQAQQNHLMISPSDIIPRDTTDQPPHFQAYNYYNEDVAPNKAGKIIVTMENPSKTKPMPLEVEVSENGYNIISGEATPQQISNANENLIRKSASTGNWCHE